MKNFINNWFLVDIDPDSPYGVRVALSQTKDVVVCGEINDRLVAVAGISEFDIDHIITKGDTKYRLGEIHPDFKEMLLAQKRQTPILDCWEITEVDDLFDDLSGMYFGMKFDDYVECYNERGHHKGYILNGICNDLKVGGEIVALRKNLVTLTCHNPYFGVSRNVNVFVVWPNMGVETAKKLADGRFKEEVSVTELEHCFSMPCRPLIQELSYYY